MLCLWTGVMEVMRQSGLADKLSKLLEPALRRLFPQAVRDREAMDSISANVSANLLGLGSAATPFHVHRRHQANQGWNNFNQRLQSGARPPHQGGVDIHPPPGGVQGDNRDGERLRRFGGGRGDHLHLWP